MADVNLTSFDLAVNGIARQRNASPRSSGQAAQARLTFMDQLYTANWREELLLAGLCFNQTVGGISAGADVALVAGGGAGTTIDSDQPEIILSVGTGKVLLVLEAVISAQVDIDADAEVGNILLFADTTQAVAATGITGTVAAPKNLLGGGPEASTVGLYGWHTVTADLTDPICSIMLAYETIRGMDVGTPASEQVAQLSLKYAPLTPVLLKGPCSVVACWGGTAAVNALASINVAVLDLARIESQ